MKAAALIQLTIKEALPLILVIQLFICNAFLSRQSGLTIDTAVCHTSWETPLAKRGL